MIELRSASRAEDSSYHAIKDAAAVAAKIGADYRLVGGHMVSLLVAKYQVTGVPTRETADADLGAASPVVADPSLPQALRGLGYVQSGGSNRFVRPIHGGLQATIDILAPSYTARHHPNQKHGELYVDLVPGLAFALACAPETIAITAHLTSGDRVDAELAVPAPLPALALKLLSYKSRLSGKDAQDIWRLLAVCRAAGVTPDDWTDKPTLRDARQVLSLFAPTNSYALKRITDDRALRGRIRALAVSVAGNLAPKR
ncbi:MAG: hypothetical protein LBK95_20465 [Bifidobacteriaceae bacterium]|jgi:hypothetical protein|nr:hypothetical protein [Bifidobacteriaceae bacterium]